MKKIATVVLLLVLSQYGISQENFTLEFGKVTQHEMTMTEYEKDKDAEALVLYELGEYFFQGDYQRGFLLHMRVKTKIKILKQAGIKYATFEIPYYQEGQDWERFENIEATTYNWDGRNLTKIPLTGKNIYEEKINENLSVKKITLSDVREGSVIEFNYTISTPYYFHMRKWDFQKKIPVIYSKLRYRAIPYYEYTYLTKGTTKFDEFNSEEGTNEIQFSRLRYKEMIYDFGMKNLPAFRDEEYITSVQDYLVSMNFQISRYHSPTGGSKNIISTWPEMCDDFLKDEDFGKYINNSEKEAKKVLPTLDLEGKELQERIETITNYVKSKYNWNGDNNKYVDAKLSNFLKQQTGNTANINLFLIGLLKGAGIEVYPVVLSTRKNGAISRHHPFRQFFNYVIAQVKVDNKTLFIDATEPMLHFSDLPERCINVEGLVIKPKTEEWISTKQQKLAYIQRDFDLSILPEENKIGAKAKYSSSGFSAYKYRTICLGKEENMIRYLKEASNIDVKNGVSIDNLEELNKPFSFSFEYESAFENVSNKLFIHPFTNLSIVDNPFKQNSRSLVIDLVYVKGESYKSKITIPKGYKIEHLPQVFNLDNNFIMVKYKAEANDDVIIVEASYSYKSNVYQAGDYIGLKMAFTDIIKKFSEMIVLAKE